MKFRRLVIVVGVVSAALLMGGCNWLYRVSVDSSGGDANKPVSNGVATSADGRYVVFGTAADDIVANDTNTTEDLFKRDLASGTTELVSIDPNGNQLSVASLEPAMSDDGRYVAFLVYNYPSEVGNRIYVRDTIAHTTIDVTSTYAPRLNVSPPSISGDGRYVAWNASNVVYDGFVMWDRQSGVTTRLDIEQGGLMYSSPQLSFSSDGRYIAFTTRNDLLGDNPENHTLVYVKDMQSGTTERVSVASDGGLPDGVAELPSISDDGRYVSFQSDATNIVPGLLADGRAEDIFVRDRTTGATVFASANAVGQDEENGRQLSPRLTGDGHKVAFHTQSRDLVAGADSSYSVVVRDLVHGTTRLASTNVLGTAIDSWSWSLSRDGNIFAFGAYQRLIASDHNGTSDVYVRTMDVPTIESVDPSTLTRGSTTPVTITGTEFTAQATVQALTSGGLHAVTVDDVSFVSSTELHATITVPADLADTTMSLIVTVPGPFPGGNDGNTADVTVTLD